MKTRSLHLAGLLLCLGGGFVRAEKLIGEGATWRYYKGNSTPPAQSGTTWQQPGFSDATWGGPAAGGFGYGDSDDATTFSDMQNGYLSVFLRKSFVIPDAGAVSKLTLAVDYDDGFIAYVNGTEVARRNLPAGSIIHSTAATAAREASRGDAGSTPQEKEFIEINPALLVTGTNVIAVSGHNVSLGSSDFSLIPELYTNVTLVRGPYIQMPNAGKARIVWRTDALTNSVLEYGLDAAMTSGTITSGALVREHDLETGDLPADSTIHYRITSGSTVLAQSTFKSLHALGSPMRFAVVGDFGWSDPQTAAVAARMALDEPDFYLTVGDNIYQEGAPGAYDPYWFEPYAAVLARTPLFPALGNHDVVFSNGQPYLDYFRLPTNGPSGLIERSYSFDNGDVHFAIVDTNPFAQGNTGQMDTIKAWLAADLAASQKPWKIVAFHHPPYTSDGPGVHSDNANVKAHLVPIIEQGGVQLVFQGHNHFYERHNAINGVYYITSGHGGRSLYTPTNVKPYSAKMNASTYGFTRVEIDGLKLRATEITENGTVIDTFLIDRTLPFTIDGLLDSGSWQRASNGLKLHAAIRGNHLYVATQDAGEGSDHFIYVASVSGTMRAANWSKSGQVMQWSAFLSDENENGFQGWFGANEQTLTDAAVYQSMTSGINNNSPATNGVLEGTLNLPSHFGAFPQQLYLAAAPFASASAGALVTSAQVPAGNGNGNIEAGEFLVINTRDLALDLPVSTAGAPGSLEAGMVATLTGTGSQSPSGFPLTYEWTQLSGPSGTLSQSGSAVGGFVLSANVGAAEEAAFKLTVNDGRFTSESTVIVSFTSMVDTDGDGLSDQEELTGINNTFTPAHPNGVTSDPAREDSDGDGMSDAKEATAGTHPNDPRSSFRILEIAPATSGSLQILWSAVPGKTYQLQSVPSLGGTWQNVGDPVVTSGSTGELTISGSGSHGFFRVKVP